MSQSWDEVMERERRKAEAGKPDSLATQREEALPGLNSDYRAASRPANRGLACLVVILGRTEFQNGHSPYRFFQYVHLGADGELGFTEGGQVVTFHFTGMNPKILTVRGRNLLQLCHYLQLHRLHWIRVADRDFTPDEALDNAGQPLPFIKSIAITPALMPGKTAY